MYVDWLESDDWLDSAGHRACFLVLRRGARVEGEHASGKSPCLRNLRRCVCLRERAGEIVCVCVCVCVCVYVCERESERDILCVSVCERESEREILRVCVCERESETNSVCVRVRVRDGEREKGSREG